MKASIQLFDRVATYQRYAARYMFGNVGQLAAGAQVEREFTSLGSRPIRLSEDFLFTINGALRPDVRKEVVREWHQKKKKELKEGGHEESLAALESFSENPMACILIRSLRSFGLQSHVEVMGLESPRDLVSDGRVAPSHASCQSPYYVQGYAFDEAIREGTILINPTQLLVGIALTDEVRVGGWKLSLNSAENKENYVVIKEGSLMHDHCGVPTLTMAISDDCKQHLLVRKTIIEHEAGFFDDMTRELKIEVDYKTEPEQFLKALYKQGGEKYKEVAGLPLQLTEDEFVKRGAELMQALFNNYQICLALGARPDDFTPEIRVMMDAFEKNQEKLARLIIGGDLLVQQSQVIESAGHRIEIVRSDKPELIVVVPPGKKPPEAEAPAPAPKRG